MTRGLGLGALVNLNHLGHYLTWHWFSISVSNLTVIILMVIAFVAALVAPFPGRKDREEAK